VYCTDVDLKREVGTSVGNMLVVIFIEFGFSKDEFLTYFTEE